MVGMGQTSTAVLPADRGDLVLTTAESLHVLGRLEGFAVDDLFAANLLKAKLQERGTTLFTLSGDLSVFGMLRENQFRLISVLERQSGRAPGEAGFIGVGDDFGLALRLEAAARTGRHVVADPDGTSHVLERYTSNAYFPQSGRFTAFFAPPLAELSGETPRIRGLLEAEGFSLWWECRWAGADDLDEARSRGFVQLWQSFLSWILRLGAGVTDEPSTGDRSTLHWVLEVVTLPSRMPAEDAEAGTRFVASGSARRADRAGEAGWHQRGGVVPADKRGGTGPARSVQPEHSGPGGRRCAAGVGVGGFATQAAGQNVSHAHGRDRRRPGGDPAAADRRAGQRRPGGARRAGLGLRRRQPDGPDDRGEEAGRIVPERPGRVSCGSDHHAAGRA